ncbi:MAG: nitrogen regulation protein NR(II) [Planctomycetota bacterium]
MVETTGTVSETESRLFLESRLFQSAAERLELVYRGLQERAARVDRELSETNEALRSALAEREQILRVLPVGVFKGHGGVVRAESPEAERLEGILGKNMDCVWGQGSPNVPQELELADRDGRTRTLRSLIVSLEGDSWLGFVEDQTTVVELRKEVERLDRISSLAELSLGIAHEIRNPMNGLAGFASLLEKNPRSPKAAAWASRIAEGARRVDRIVTDLLVFARPERRGRLVARTINEWIQDAREEARSLAVDISPETADRRILGFPQALGRVFVNLFLNASEAGASGIAIDCSDADPAGRVRILLRDDGPGLEPSIAERAFDPFVGTRDGGTGLGLAFCARAVEAMAGRIRCLQGQGGACFELELSEVTESEHDRKRLPGSRCG